MKILFVDPLIKYSFRKIISRMPFNFPSKIYFSTSNKAITFPVLAELTPDKYSIEILEAEADHIDYSKDYDLVGITSFTCQALEAYNIADKFRENGGTVVMGGYHPSALPMEAKQHADSVVIGEAEETWPQLLKDFEKGGLKPFYYPSRPVPAELIPHVNNNLFSNISGSVINATRGCPYNCKYCSISNQIFRNVLRKRPIEDVVLDVKNLSQKSFFLFDNSISLDPSYSKKLFKEIKALNKKFIAYGNISVIGENEELLKSAREAGLTSLMIGFESISQETLNNIGKTKNLVDNYISSIKKIHDHGIIILGLFMFGFDNDTLDVFDNTYEFVRKSGIDLPYSHILNPMPGTPLFKQFEEEGRILTTDWSKYDFAHVVFKPKHMTPQELYDNTNRLNLKYYKLGNYMRRLLNAANINNYPFLESVWLNTYLKFRIKSIPRELSY